MKKKKGMQAEYHLLLPSLEFFALMLERLT